LLGLGTDLVEISRVGALLQRHGSRFRDRVFSAAEPGGAWSGDADDEAAALAGNWAAREAFLKALGAVAAGVPLSAIEVGEVGELGEAAGRAPVLRLSGAAAGALEAMGGRSAHLSLARAGDWAAALVAIA
jgi:holo-[acyl-carrier protein] synthase